MAALPSGKNAKELGLKEGDRFRVVDDRGISEAKVGDTLELSHDDGSRCPFFYNLTTDPDKKRGVRNACAYLKSLEPLTDPQPEVPTFKPGDKVRHKETGKIVTVEAVPGMPEYDKLHFGDAGAGFTHIPTGWSRRKNYELVEAAPEPQPKPKFKVGDTVKVVRQFLYNGTEQPNSSYIGKEFVVERNDDTGHPGFPYKFAGMRNAYSDAELELVKPAPEPELRGKSAPVVLCDEAQDLVVDETWAQVALRPRLSEYNVFTWNGLEDLVKEPKKEKKTIMATVTEKIKALKLKANPDQKALYDAGFIDIDGDLTDTGDDALNTVLQEMAHEKLVALAKELNEDDAAEKKKAKK